MSIQTARVGRRLCESQTGIDADDSGEADGYSVSDLAPTPALPCGHAWLEVIRQVGCKLVAAAERIAVALERLGTHNGRTGTANEVTAFAERSNADATRTRVQPRGSTTPDPEHAQLFLDRVLERLEALESRQLQILDSVKGPPMPQPKDFYTVAEVAEGTGLSKWTIRDACNEGRIKAEKIENGQWRIPHDKYEKIKKYGLPPPTRTTPPRTG